MGWGLIFFFVMLSVGVPAFASGLYPEDGVGSFLPEFRNAPVIGERPVFGQEGKKVAGLRLLTIQGRHLEIVYGEFGASRVPLLLGTGGRFLTDSTARAEDFAKRIIQTRFGDSGQIGRTILVRGGSFSYWARIDYSQKGKPLGNLLFDLSTQKILVANPQSKEQSARDRPYEPGPPTEPQVPRKLKTLTSVPFYPLFFSDRATCLAMILGYWAANGYPELMGIGASSKDKEGDPIRQWIRGIDLIGRGCSECQSIGKTVELISTWSRRPLAVKLIRGDAASDGWPSFQVIQGLIDENQPFLLVDTSCEPPRYAVGVGYLVAGRHSFVACLMPAAEDVMSVWKPVFINWENDFQSLQFYQISPSRRNG
jgi:hypothetical protein